MPESCTSVRSRLDRNLKAGLIATGHHYHLLPLYRTIVASEPNQSIQQHIARNEFDAVVVLAPSALHGFLAQSGDQWEHARHLPVVCIGQTTAKTARELGMTSVTVAAEPTSLAVASSLVMAIHSKSSHRLVVYSEGNRTLAVAIQDQQLTFQRHRRTRSSNAMRRFVQETSFEARDLVYPLFVTHGIGVRREIPSMPGQFQMSIDQLEAEMDELGELGIESVLLFGIPETKDAIASSALDPDGVVQQAIRTIKASAPDVLIIADVCACEYTNHGHCGILVGEEIDNDQSVELLARIAVSLADAGADIIAPSDMMDGRVAAIRHALDHAGYEHTPIMSYAAKYASGFYGPFREAAGSTPQFGDRRSHQMDPANAREALREMATDLSEGADMIIVKPALAYLDILRTARDTFDVPMIAYNVSGEYAMVKAAGLNGWIDEKRIVMEMLISMKRAGANRVITYFAKDVARWLAPASRATSTDRPASTIDDQREINKCHSNTRPAKRQFVKFNFFKIAPEWRRLDAETQDRQIQPTDRRRRRLGRANHGPYVLDNRHPGRCRFHDLASQLRPERHPRFGNRPDGMRDLGLADRSPELPLDDEALPIR